jgi:hypothetical protein
VGKKREMLVARKIRRGGEDMMGEKRKGRGRERKK